jgi:hypothetical protein
MMLRATIFLSRISPLSLLLAVTLGVVIALFGFGFTDAQRRLLDAEIAIAQQSAPAVTRAVVIDADLPVKRMDALKEILPSERSAESEIKKLFLLARNEGLELLQAEYSRSGSDAAPLLRLQLRLPVQGSYSAIRSFIGNALLTMPFLSIDELSFRREETGNAEGEASLRLSIFLLREPAK